MAKYRIVSRNSNPWGEPQTYPWYYLQRKILNKWWIDCWRLPFGWINSYSTEYEEVVEFYNQTYNKTEVVETVIRVFDDEP